MVAVFVVATFILFILVDGALQWNKARRKELQAVPAKSAGWTLALGAEAVQAPAGLFLDTGHTWLALDASGRSRVGMDAFVPRIIGQIDKVELPEPGKTIARGEKLFSIRQGEREAAFVAPVDGVVSAVNESVGRDPQLVKADPYQRGWICVLNPTNLAKDLKKLMVAEETKGWLQNEIDRFREFFSVRAVQHLALGHVMQDGGEITGGVMEVLDDESWARFAETFLAAGDRTEEAETQNL